MKILSMSVVVLMALMTTAWAQSHSNEAMKQCLQKYNYSVDNFDSFDFTKAANCHSDYRVGENNKQLAELRDFLKHNPRYRVPGQSQNKCWGKPRVQPFESVSGTAGTWGYDITVKYKDTIPAGCYENGPWDNRYEN